jgi:hypothetical protein
MNPPYLLILDSFDIKPVTLLYKSRCNQPIGNLWLKQLLLHKLIKLVSKVIIKSNNDTLKLILLFIYNSLEFIAENFCMRKSMMI